MLPSLARAIVWQHGRTAAFCEQLREQGLEPAIQRSTGLRIDPYFSGTKLRWLLDHVSGAHIAAAQGELAFGTVDSWLLWKLTGGKVHATDATNASRTLLYNIATNQWDDELLKLLRVPRPLLAEVKDCADDYGVTDKANGGYIRDLSADLALVDGTGAVRANQIGFWSSEETFEQRPLEMHLSFSATLSAFPPGTPIRRLTLDEAIIAVSAHSHAGLGDGMSLGQRGHESGIPDLEQR